MGRKTLFWTICCSIFTWNVWAEEKKDAISPDVALQMLVDGNKRSVSDKMSHPNQSQSRRTAVAKGQKPFAVVVTCSDSRVPPEIIFDQGVGDLFVIRTAGEVVGDIELGSIEYAVEHLGAPLVLVMGHEKCGAVDATVKGGDVPGHIGSIVNLIKPAVEKAKKKEGDLLTNAIKANVSLVAQTISESEIVKELVEHNKVKIVRALYDLDDGSVQIKE